MMVLWKDFVPWRSSYKIKNKACTLVQLTIPFTLALEKFGQSNEKLQSPKYKGYKQTKSRWII
jgi:hypothetical protein